MERNVGLISGIGLIVGTIIGELTAPSYATISELTHCPSSFLALIEFFAVDWAN